MKKLLQCLTAALAVICAVGVSTPVFAQDNFPSRPIRLVVSYAAGGGPDVFARIVAQKLSENLGQGVVVENRPGGGGVIAAQFVMSAPADGYTLLVADNALTSINPHVYPKLPYDTLKDFMPVTLAVYTPLFLAVNAKLPTETVKQFIDHAKAQPGLPYGSSGNGSFHHLSMELLKTLSSINMTHIPYKGTGQSMPALIAGDTVANFGVWPAVAPFAKSGKIRVIGVTTSKRASIAPDVPTIAEAGVPGYALEADIGFLVATGTPRPVVAKLNAEILKVLRMPDVIQRMAGAGFETAGTTPEHYGETIRDGIQKYGKLVRDAGVRVE